MVREAALTDASFIIQSQIKMAFETEGLRLDPPTVDKGVHAFFEDPAKGKYFIAVENGENIGCLLTIPEWSDWRNGTVLWIHSLWVEPEFRKKKVFQSLYTYLKAKVVSTPGLRGLRLYVDRRNQIAQKAYERVGMTKEHYEMFEWMKTF